MKCLNWNEVNEVATKQLGKFCVYISNNLSFSDIFDGNEQKISDEAIFEIVKVALSDLYSDEIVKFMSGDLVMGGLFVFDTEQEARVFYEIFELEHVESSGIYANLISPTEGTLTENT